MELKKTPEADLEKGKITFLLMGFAVALSGFFVLLEWQSFEKNNSDWTSLVPVFIENEFTGGIQPEKTDPDILPEIVNQEIVYEDYVITDDTPLIEEQENIASSLDGLEDPEESQLIHTQSDPIEIIEREANTDDTTTSVAETMPQFPGGQIELIRFIYENIQYPSVALKQRIEGRVWCSFVVETDGSISNVNLEEGVYIFLDEEAVRVLKKMPDWLPGRTEGENVRVKIYIPIVFKR